jgi:uncharacterized membrane protein
MSDDRYAPPQANLTRAADTIPGSGSFDLGLAFNEAWSATWANFGLLLGVSVVATLLMLSSALTVVGIFLLVPVFAWGVIRFMLNTIDGRPEFSDLFSGFQDYGRTLLAMLILFALSSLISALGQTLNLIGTAAGSDALEAIGTVVNLAWTFLVMARLNFAWFYAVDQGLGPVEALQASWDATSELKANCAALIVMSLVVILVGLLCLIIGVIPAAMIAYLLPASAYRQMAGRQSAPA